MPGVGDRDRDDMSASTLAMPSGLDGVADSMAAEVGTKGAMTVTDGGAPTVLPGGLPGG